MNVNKLFIKAISKPTHKCQCGAYINSNEILKKCPFGCEGLIKGKK